MNQGTPEWLLARCGHVTASRFKDVMAKVKVGEAAGRRDYRWELITERITGLPCEQYQNRAMDWGTEHEALARISYEAESGNVVEEVGFINHPVVPWAGCSPDGLVGDAGGCEIKCPYSSVVHVETLAGGMPTEHRAQVQGALWVTGRQWWDFVSFDPRMPGNLRIYIERVLRDEDYIRKLADEVHAFLAEVEKQHKGILLLRSAA